MLTSAHDMVAVIADHKPAENIIMFFPVLDVDFEKSLNILKEFTVDDCRTIFFIIPKHSDVFCVCEHVLETGSGTNQSELRFHMPERFTQIPVFSVELKDCNGGRRIVIRSEVFVLDGISERS